MRKIKEIIIVEGKHDVAFLKTFLDAEFIETNGLGLNESTKEMIKELYNQGNEFIVLTDPDFPGEKIRKEIEKIVPNCKHAFVSKQNSISKNKRKVGVEHTTKQEVLEALKNTITFVEKESKIELKDLIDLGLVGQEKSSILRKKIEVELHLGHGSSKTFLKRINLLNLDKENTIKKVKEIIDGTNCNS